MKTSNPFKLLWAVLLFNVFVVMGQEKEPMFIGGVCVLTTDNSYCELEKEFGDHIKGISMAHNSWNVHSLEVSGSKAKKRFTSVKQIQLVVRAADNSFEPLTVVNIYKFKSKRKVRSVTLSEDNSWTLMRSRTHSNNTIHFKAVKYGTSSYLITLEDMEPGEYGVSLANPGNPSQEKVILSCFAIDK